MRVRRGAVESRHEPATNQPFSRLGRFCCCSCICSLFPALATAVLVSQSYHYWCACPLHSFEFCWLCTRVHSVTVTASARRLCGWLVGGFSTKRPVLLCSSRCRLIQSRRLCIRILHSFVALSSHATVATHADEAVDDLRHACTRTSDRPLRQTDRSAQPAAAAAAAHCRRHGGASQRSERAAGAGNKCDHTAAAAS